MTDSRVETLSVATVPEQHRSSSISQRPVPGRSPTLGRSLMFRCEGQSCLTQPDDSSLPVVLNHDSSLANDEQDDNGQSSMQMQVSFPVELLPHVVNIDSD